MPGGPSLQYVSYCEHQVYCSTPLTSAVERPTSHHHLDVSTSRSHCVRYSDRDLRAGCAEVSRKGSSGQTRDPGGLMGGALGEGSGQLRRREMMLLLCGTASCWKLTGGGAYPCAMMHDSGIARARVRGAYSTIISPRRFSCRAHVYTGSSSGPLQKRPRERESKLDSSDSSG